MHTDHAPVVIVGAGGHAAVVCDAAERAGRRVLGFLVDEAPDHIEVMGRAVWTDPGGLPPDAEFVIAIADTHTRQRIAARWRTFATIIHPSAMIGSGAEIGTGSMILAGAVVNPRARIGQHCIVNTNASVDHDCDLGDFTMVGPGAALGGNVRMAEGSVVSIGATVIHGVSIGAHTVIGAGAVVLNDLPANTLSYGVPCRVVRSRSPEEPFL